MDLDGLLGGFTRQNSSGHHFVFVYLFGVSFLIFQSSLLMPFLWPSEFPASKNKIFRLWKTFLRLADFRKN